MMHRSDNLNLICIDFEQYACWHPHVTARTGTYIMEGTPSIMLQKNSEKCWLCCLTEYGGGDFCIVLSRIAHCWIWRFSSCQIPIQAQSEKESSGQSGAAEHWYAWVATKCMWSTYEKVTFIPFFFQSKMKADLCVTNIIIFDKALEKFIPPIFGYKSQMWFKKKTHFPFFQIFNNLA